MISLPANHILPTDIWNKILDNVEHKRVCKRVCKLFRLHLIDCGPKYKLLDYPSHRIMINFYKGHPNYLSFFFYKLHNGKYIENLYMVLTGYMNKSLDIDIVLKNKWHTVRFEKFTTDIVLKNSLILPNSPYVKNIYDDLENNKIDNIKIMISYIVNKLNISTSWSSVKFALELYFRKARQE